MASLQPSRCPHSAHGEQAAALAAEVGSFFSDLKKASIAQRPGAPTPAAAPTHSRPPPAFDVRSLFAEEEEEEEEALGCANADADARCVARPSATLHEASGRSSA